MSIVYPKALFASGYKRCEKGTCFVLMPFDDQYNEVYRVIRASLESQDLNLLCRRADDFREPNILHSILRHIALTEYVVADLTGRNPNVFYELGIAHCIKDSEKVVLLTQSMEYVPFDLRQLRCVVYAQTESGLRELHDELLATFKEASRNSFRFKVHENRRFVFGKKLVGSKRNLFELSIESLHVGHDVVKLMIHFRQYSLDGDTVPADPQLLFLSEDQRSARLENIPWEMHLLRVEDSMALIALEKC